MWLRHCLVSNDPFESGCEQFPGEWLAVLRCRCIECTAVGEVSGAVVQVEIRCARRPERLCGRLIGVDQIRETPVRPFALGSKSFDIVVWILFNIIGADGYDRDVFAVRCKQFAQADLDVADIWAVIASEENQQWSPVHKIADADHVTGKVRQGDCRKSSAKWNGERIRENRHTVSLREAVRAQRECGDQFR